VTLWSRQRTTRIRKTKEPREPQKPEESKTCENHENYQNQENQGTKRTAKTTRLKEQREPQRTTKAKEIRELHENQRDVSSNTTVLAVATTLKMGPSLANGLFKILGCLSGCFSPPLSPPSPSIHALAPTFARPKSEKWLGNGKCVKAKFGSVCGGHVN